MTIHNPTSLQGLRVLITRPAQQSSGLAEAIQSAGGGSVRFPLLKISEITGPEHVARIRRLIQELDHYQVAIFISVNAAQYGRQWISRYWPQLPTSLDLYAVGPATAAALAGLGRNVNHPAAGMSSEDLLDMPGLADLQGKRVLIFRGEGGRELLAGVLSERGADVTYLEMYRREGPSGTADAFLQLIREKRVNVITVTSVQILDTLCNLVDIKNSGVELIPLLVPSQRVAVLARQAGFTQVFNCNGATDSAIVTTLQDIAAQMQT